MKTKLLLLLFIISPFLQSQSNKINISIVENSVQSRNDSLYFQISIKNSMLNEVAFYNLNNIDFDGPWVDELFIKNACPRVMLSVLDNSNKYSKYFRSNTGNFKSFCPIVKTCTILKPNTLIKYNLKISLWPINLKSGKYKIQLRYFNNEYYKKEFAIIKKNNPNLKKCIFFKGIIKSNTSSFNYPSYPKRF